MAKEEDKTTKKISALPSTHFYMKNYALSLGENDQKAVGVFYMYEPAEKMSRFKSELIWIKDDLVTEPVLLNVVGLKRKHKYTSYSEWARFMLIWISQIKK